MCSCTDLHLAKATNYKLLLSCPGEIMKSIWGRRLLLLLLECYYCTLQHYDYYEYSMLNRTTIEQCETSTGSQKRRKLGLNESPDKSYYILSKPLDICGKCKKMHVKGRDNTMYTMCCVWDHAVCEGIQRDQYKAIKSLFSLDNLVYHYKVNNCINRFKNITNE